MEYHIIHQLFLFHLLLMHILQELKTEAVNAINKNTTILRVKKDRLEQIDKQMKPTDLRQLLKRGIVKEYRERCTDKSAGRAPMPKSRRSR